ncbi:MAG TPA: amino acid--[acyl-carrier-protein] ligase [Polyangiaceae bacterium]|jgi:seryl-tRNA synthetase|nr:amino acid--[acyl-carrier-protein] ligase [Polyangiaceae bacterium]
MTEYTPQKLYDDLVAHRHIIPVGVQGIFGRGAVFEDVLRRFDAVISRVAASDGAEVMAFPPTLDRKVLEKSEYLDSFPNLAGAVFSFFGKEGEAMELSGAIHAGKSWEAWQKMTDVVLTPAACYPVYPSFTGTIPEQGHLVDMQNWVFRHEPSNEPTRMQAFRVREFVRVGGPDTVVDWRDMWLKRGVEMLQSLGLPAQSDVASDPFFGRGGRMLAANQKQQKLKFEVLVPVISETKHTAICSFNYHQDHFGKLFDIKTQSGELAQTACLGFGLERCVMALFKTHGMVPSEWPKAVREILWP